MNHVIMLAGGVGMRMNTNGVPKQFLSLYGKPIIIYTLEKFSLSPWVDDMVVVCHRNWMDYMKLLVEKYSISKNVKIVEGGKDRQDSVNNGIAGLGKDIALDDVVLIHDSVRPLVSLDTIEKNIEQAKIYGCVMTVKPAIETVVVANGENAEFTHFQQRDISYSLTSPQSFRMDVLQEIMCKSSQTESDMPILDMAMMYAFMGNKVYMVKEKDGSNIKITTPVDYYYFKAIVELEENKKILGL